MTRIATRLAAVAWALLRTVTTVHSTASQALQAAPATQLVARSR